MHADTSANVSASLYSASAANATLRLVVDSCKSTAAADGKTGYRSPDANGISGESENVCICTSLLQCRTSITMVASAVAPYHVINERLIKLRNRLRSLCCTIKAWVHIMHVNFSFPFKLGPEVGLRIIHCESKKKTITSPNINRFSNFFH